MTSESSRTRIRIDAMYLNNNFENVTRAKCKGLSERIADTLLIDFSYL